MSTEAYSQVRDKFDKELPQNEPAPSEWRTLSGDGNVKTRLERIDGFARFHVDATKDDRNVWWAVMQRSVSDDIDLEQFTQENHQLRIEARVRSPYSPRRINLSVNTQRTTNYHINLKEYDLAKANTWYTISLTTDALDAKPGDTVNVQLALMDWGTNSYHVDVDYFEVAMIEKSKVTPDLGEPIPYHPPVPDIETFEYARSPIADTTLDSIFSNTNFSDWMSQSDATILAVGGSRFAVLRWDFSDLDAPRIDGPGVLELTSLYSEKHKTPIKDFGLIRVAEVLGGDPDWDKKEVTLSLFLQDQSLSQVINPQMIIDQAVTPVPNSENRWVISESALQRLLSGETHGIALMPLGAIHAAFYSNENPNPAYTPKLYFNLHD